MPNKRSFDYILTGAGPAGCVLAARLTEDPTVSVLLVEAGPKDRNPYIHMPAGFAKLTGSIGNWGWSTTPQDGSDGKVFWYPQGKVLGGGSSINAQIYARGNAADYDAWADEAGCAGWRYADVLPYFKRAEDNERFADAYHGVGGPLGVSDPVNPHPTTKRFLRAGQQAGIPFNPDFNGERQAGIGLYQLTQRRARRCSAAEGFLRPALSRPNLTLMTGRHITRITTNNGRATGVEVATKDGRAEAFEAEREVLVTSGAIGSPRLLMLSGIGPADHLRSVGVGLVHDLPGVGRNLQDHVDVFVVNELIGDFSYDKHLRPHKAAWAGLQYILFRKGPVASNIYESGGFWYADPNARSPDIQFHFGLGAGIEKGQDRLKNCGITLNSAFLRPRSRGSVTLASSDPFAAPNIDPNYWGDPYDMEMSVKGFRLAREIMSRPAMAEVIKAERLPGPSVRTDAEIAAYARKFGKTDYHPVGTCKMGTDPMSVVDPATLQVHGLEGLRVLDSSVMPILVSSNTNAPTIMVAEKGADLVRGIDPLPPSNLG